MHLSVSSLKTLTAQFVKAAGKQSILQTKPVQIHGINPSLKYETSGKYFELPRFSSVEMQQARMMNKIALRQIKTPVNRKYEKATVQDYKRLTSEAIEDTYSRVEWTNPKDGKTYNLIKQGMTDDGKIKVRILDAEGAFIKEAELTPKNIIILDNFQEQTRFFDLSHGDLVSVYARRYNPFANYIKIQKDLTSPDLHADINAVKEAIKREGKADYISFSYSVNVKGAEPHKVKISRLPDRMQKLIKQDSSRLDNIKDARILCSAGNANSQESAKNITNHLLVSQERVEGVGSLSNTTGKISGFSSSRNAELTQHYELGEFVPRLTPYGINVTGLKGTDIEINPKLFEAYRHNPLAGKSVERVNNLINKIQTEINNLHKEAVGLFKQKKNISEIFNEKQKIDKKIMMYEQRKKKLLDFANQLFRIDGRYEISPEKITGTSFSTPVRSAKLALNDMMEGIL